MLSALSRRFGGVASFSIRDRYETLEEVKTDLRKAGLQQAALVVTAQRRKQGKSFEARALVFLLSLPGRRRLHEEQRVRAPPACFVLSVRWTSIVWARPTRALHVPCAFVAASRETMVPGKRVPRSR
jgi:hypothetical protein